MKKYCLNCRKCLGTIESNFQTMHCSTKCSNEWRSHIHFIYTDWKVPMGINGLRMIEGFLQFKSLGKW